MTAREPAQDDIIAVIGQHPDGVGAGDLTDAFTARGFAPSDVGRAIRSALDAGTVGLGREMQLVLADAPQKGFLGS